MNPLLIEKFESINELFTLALIGLDDTLKNNKLSEEDIDNLIAALQTIGNQYRLIAKEAKQDTEN